MGIVIETTRMKVYRYMCDLCSFCGYEQSWTDDLWKDIVLDKEIYEEFIYYLQNHTFLDSVSIGGYSLSDLYVFQMSKYNLIREIGKNPVECNKERMVMNAFRMLVDMKIDPTEFIKRIEEGKGRDKGI